MGSYSPLMPKPIRLITSPTHHVAGLSASRLYSWASCSRGDGHSQHGCGASVKCVLKSWLILSRSVPSAPSLYSSLILFCPSFLIHFFLASFGPPSLASCRCFALLFLPSNVNHLNSANLCSPSVPFSVPPSLASCCFALLFLPSNVNHFNSANLHSPSVPFFCSSITCIVLFCLVIPAFQC